MGYGLLEMSPGGCPCCSPDSELQSKRRRLISASEASTSGRSMTTHAAASASGQATAETIEGPEALKAYVDRRIQLFEHFKLRESEAVHPCHPKQRALYMGIACQAICMPAAAGMTGRNTYTHLWAPGLCACTTYCDREECTPCIMAKSGV